MAAAARPICYVGHGLGSQPFTATDTAGKGIVWNTSDRRVRMVPSDVADELLRHHPADFRECAPLDKGYGELDADKLGELAKDGKATIVLYSPKGGSDQIPMLVLDEATMAAVDEASGAVTVTTVKKPAAKKGKE